MKLTESIIENAALDWLHGLNNEILASLAIAPGETDAYRTDFKQVFLSDWLQTNLLSSELRLPSQSFGMIGMHGKTD